jgi:hypothetical protein
MRPYLVLCVVVLIAVAAFGQQGGPARIYGSCLYGGCGPFVPLVTTPMISLQQFSPNPVGASNATTGLTAGATNSTLSQIPGETSSTYTVPVWYVGGSAPLITPAIHLQPEPLRNEMRHPAGAEHERGARKSGRGGWAYISGREYTASAVDASGSSRGLKKASRTYINSDVERQNQNNGSVKLDGKVEKL